MNVVGHPAYCMYVQYIKILPDSLLPRQSSSPLAEVPYARFYASEYAKTYDLSDIVALPPHCGQRRLIFSITVCSGANPAGVAYTG